MENKMLILSLKSAAIAGVALCGLAALLLYDRCMSRVVILNDAPYDLTGVEVGIGAEGETALRQVFWRGTVKSHRTQWIAKIANAEGSWVVRMARDGRPVEMMNGYVSGVGFPVNVKICVPAQGEIGIEQWKPWLDRFLFGGGEERAAVSTACRHSS
jgi:hypothetical protein